MSRIGILFITLLVGPCIQAQIIYEQEEYVYEEDLYDTLDRDLTAVYLFKDSSFKDNYRGKDFIYQENEPPPQRTMDTAPKRSVNVGGGLQLIFNILLALAIGFILYILFRIFKDFKVRKRSKETGPQVVESTTEREFEELDKNDLLALINQAKADLQFSLALRYYFLLFLERLQQKDILKYHIDKTNYDYLMEIQDPTQNNRFVKLSYLYEHVWYGKKAVDQGLFYSMEKIFNEQIELI